VPPTAPPAMIQTLLDSSEDVPDGRGGGEACRSKRLMQHEAPVQRNGVGAETNRIRLVLFYTQNRAFGPLFGMQGAPGPGATGDA
jgi:hypothetical protein